MELRLLGELEAVADDGSVMAVRGGKQRALLAVLALHRGEPLGAERLIDVLWGDEPPGNPTNALQALIANLRRALGAAAVVTTDAGYALALSPDDVDIVRFEQLVLQGRRALDDGDPAIAATLFDDALALRRGEPLAEFAFSEFADGERARLDELVLVALEARIDAQLQLGHHDEVVGELESLCAQHPLRERLWELRMLALYRGGRQAEALRVYRDAREQLIDELGLEPGPALRDLEARVLAQDPTLAGVDRVAARPERMPSGNLRQQLTSFVGRETDIERLRDALAEHRLVTLIGPGGSGKTRLAIEAAARLQPDFNDGAWFVELAAVRDGDGVAPAMYAALKIGESAAADADGFTVPIVDQLIRHLVDRTLIVVLDNCEHVIADAAALAEALTSALPDLRVVATSREALAVPGEVLIPVGGLELDAAVTMFQDRGQAVRADFAITDANRELVDDICRRLDGLPLAVELAAARVRSLPLAQLVERLDDRFRLLTGGARTALPRQQTLRAVVDWSYDLLFEAERQVFARLSVFTGGCTLEAAEKVCSDDVVAPDEICDLLLHLVDKSLVLADLGGDDEGRYTQLQTLWQYARERLAESKDATACRDRHAHWFLDLATSARPLLRGRTGPETRARVDSDFDNLRAALDWFAANDDAAGALALVDGIAWCWFARNDPHEATRWLGDALAVSGRAPAELRSMVVAWHAYYGAQIFGPIGERAELEAAVETLRNGSDLRRLGDALMILAELRNRHNDAAGSLVAVDEVRPVLVQLEDEWGIAICDSLTSRNLALQGDLDGAADAARSSVARLKAIGEEWLVFEGLGLLAILIEVRGELDEAATAYMELIDHGHRLGLPLYQTQWMMRLASLRARQGDDEAAEELFRAFLAADSIPNAHAWTLVGLAGALRRRGKLDEARVHLDEALEMYESLALESGCAAALTGLSWWAITAGDLDAASTFAAEAQRRAANDTDFPIAVAADMVAAAVAVSTNDSPEARITLDEVLERRLLTPGRYIMVAGGPMGASLDEPDVAAFVASISPDLSR